MRLQQVSKRKKNLDHSEICRLRKAYDRYLFLRFLEKAKRVKKSSEQMSKTSAHRPLWVKTEQRRTNFLLERPRKYIPVLYVAKESYFQEGL